MGKNTSFYTFLNTLSINIFHVNTKKKLYNNFYKTKNFKIGNTGCNRGIIRLLEQRLNRPLQWFICLLHFNELPLKHLIEEIYGRAIGPTSFCGKETPFLQICETLPVHKFKAVQTDYPEVDRKDLSSDQKYLWDIAHAVSSGTC